ncbi:MAG: hypothetical protein Q8R92_07030 [Deltaproteobacteria bacterium]|nr:hypothetical protein [Deltaproteobacteria bacterium]
MPVVKRLVCLANSRKLSGRCVAGKEQAEEGPGPWVRPVSERPMEEVSEHERQYEDGSDPRVLDIMDVPLKGHHPKAYQSENWLLDPDYYWKRAGRATWDDLDALADDPAALWVNGFSTGSGSNDRVRLSDAALLGSSLYLLYSDQLKVRVFAPGTSFGNPKRRVQAEFSHRGITYRLWVTDPLVERKYLAGSNGEYPIGECFVTVSLGEPHEGYCYKLVAALITPDRELDRSS